jgi:hypothetical protein
VQSATGPELYLISNAKLALHGLRPGVGGWLEFEQLPGLLERAAEHVVPPLPPGVQTDVAVVICSMLPISLSNAGMFSVVVRNAQTSSGPHAIVMDSSTVGTARPLETDDTSHVLAHLASRLWHEEAIWTAAEVDPRPHLLLGFDWSA